MAVLQGVSVSKSRPWSAVHRGSTENNNNGVPREFFVARVKHPVLLLRIDLSLTWLHNGRNGKRVVHVDAEEGIDEPNKDQHG